MREFSDIADQLDDGVLQELLNADPARAREVFEDLSQKGDVRNPSAFITKALKSHPYERGSVEARTSAYAPRAPQAYPAFATAFAGRRPAAVTARPASFSARPQSRSSQHPVDRILSQHPGLAFDDKCLDRLYQIDVDRAIEIINDIIHKGDVKNPSAFAMKAMNDFPQRRANPIDLDQALSRHRDVADALDAKALRQLQSADPARAVEIVEDVASQPNIHNVSAFVAKALRTHPTKRGGDDNGMPAAKRPRMESGPSSYRPQRSHTGPALDLDDKARQKLEAADPARAEEVLEELRAKGSEIRNPSAFVCKSLQQYPHLRGR